MAPSRKTINGRSPLVNKRHQITAFFSKSPNSINISKYQNPSSSPPTSPSPIYGKTKPKSTSKPVLVIGAKKGEDFVAAECKEEVVGRRIRVYRPMDEWYEGRVKAYDKVAAKHVVEYDDHEEEVLDLSKEKFEWVDQGKSGDGSNVRKFRWLRKEEDDSSDEDLGKNAAEEDCVKEMALAEEDEEEEAGRMKRKRGENIGGGGEGKRQKEGGDSSSGKKKKGGFVVGEFGRKPVGSVLETKRVDDVEKVNIDALERFGMREEQKFSFLGKDRRDAKRRLPSDPDYDPRTLYLPPPFLNKLTGAQRQWWEFKSNHMDKVLFFKMGKFYELFEMDAHVGVKELDLQYMKGEQPHCGFPEKNFSINVEKLARKGYRVLVVEQTETPNQLEMRRREEGSKDKVVKREICAVVTIGTLTEGEISAGTDASYIMSVIESRPVSSDKKEERLYGVCVVDVATSRVIIGQIKDDVECSGLCCLLSVLRPVEIIKPASLLSAETEKALTKYTKNPLVNELIHGVEYWDADTTVHQLKSFYSGIKSTSGSSPENSTDTVSNMEDESSWLPDVIHELLTAGDGGSLALSAFGGSLYYLKQAFLDETLLRFAKFESLPCSGFRDAVQKPYMVLDAAAMENLEIFENSRNGDSSGTLYAQLNHCGTASGRRLLKTWLARPLYHAESIKERQDAILGLRGNNLLAALEFRDKLSMLPDMEKLFARLFASSEANGRNGNNIILYEDAAKKQLQEFISVLRGCEVMILACSALGSILGSTDSGLLHHLLVPGKGLPDVRSTLNQFKNAFDWEEANSSGRIIPHEGADTEYDTASEKIREIESNLQQHLKEQRKVLGDKLIKYVIVGKDRYLLEVPKDSHRIVPGDYELRSSKKGFSRYWSPYIREMVGELEKVEAEKELKLKSILQRLIKRFCEHHTEWRRFVSAVAELDALISLVISSDYYEGPTCRPSIFIGSNPNETPRIKAKSLGHPVLKSDSLGRGAFVPNDINIGGSDQATFILLTGPNMGGKSTLLRQICLAVVLAQIGGDVPAEKFELSLADRIFVRMGAKDHIMAGQSTFLTELSETAFMLTSATRNSLVALDELGRGTSTSDGQAIAESVLEHFVHKVQCRGMFSTHYHRLATDYRKDPKVSLCHMACKVGNVDGGLEEVTFLYRLTPGACPKSYGVNVAKIAGIPNCVLHKAAAKSRDFETVYSRQCGRSKEEKNTRSLIRNLLGLTSDAISHELVSDTSTTLLCQLQKKARILLEQC